MAVDGGSVIIPQPSQQLSLSFSPQQLSLSFSPKQLPLSFSDTETSEMTGRRRST